MEAGSSLDSVDGVVHEIMRLHRSLPPRPAIEEVEAAKDLIQNLEKEDQLRLEAIARKPKGPQVPQELMGVLLEMQKSFVLYQSMEQKREALRLLDLENLHMLFDEMIQRASRCIPSGDSSISGHYSHAEYSNGSTQTVASSNLFTTSAPAAFTPTVFSSSVKEVAKSSELFTRDDSYVTKSKAKLYGDGTGTALGFSKPQIVDSTLNPSITSGQDGDKLSLIRLASLIEVSSKKDTKELNLQNKLLDQVEWLPDSIGKLSTLITLDLSENRISALPTTIGGLASLTKLDLHSNRISELPDTIGNLFSLVILDVRGNQLTSLPSTIGRLLNLEELDLSSNLLQQLPESVGSLGKLKKLNVETNNVEEFPHTIGHCTSLQELRADYNRLKALPEAVGRIETLEVLSVRYNNIKQLPTTMSSLLRLRELDISFNELESVPESLCFATSLVKINVGNNFADLRTLPRSIGNLENLEELDISNNQIRVLPESFRMLTNLRVLRIQENPLEVPPRHIAEKGAQAVVQFMSDLVANKDVKVQPTKQKKTWAQRCFFSRSNKRKRSGLDYMKTEAAPFQK
uniref:Disease resistance R13L4/SHOC-2-like LRR domain-containing protein n=1 Tax=Kalanchoe fedtschenkoi TaxID=63787 RepID=A0A7N0UJL2_KALFE